MVRCVGRAQKPAVAASFIDDVGKWLLQDGSNVGASWQSITSISSNANFARAKVRRFSGNKFILGYANSSNYPVVRIIEVDFGAGTYSVGTAVQLETNTRAISGIHIISSTHFLVRTMFQTTNSGQLFACSVSGTTITAGSGTGCDSTGGAIIQGNTTKSTFLEIYRGGTTVVAVRFTVSGTTVTRQGATNIITGLTSLSGQYLMAATVADGVGIVAYTNNTNGVDLIARLFTFNEDGSGTPAAVGSPSTVGASTSTQAALSDLNVAYYWNCQNLLVVSHAATGDKYVLGLYVCDVTLTSSARWWWAKYDASAPSTLTTDNNPNSRDGVWSEDVMTDKFRNMTQVANKLAIGMGLKYATTERLELNALYFDALSEDLPILIKQVMGLFRAESDITSNTLLDAGMDISEDGNGALMAVARNDGSVIYRHVKHPTAIA